MFLYGKNSVYERLKVNPRTIRKIFVQDNFDDRRILEKMKSLGITAQRVGKDRLNKIKRADNLGGIIAQVDNFKYVSLEDLVYRPEDKKISCIFLDRVYDPQNLGAIIRTAACFGGFGIVLPKHKACGVTEAVLHVACGGENYVPIVMVSSISGAIIEAKRCGFWIVGTAVNGGKNITTAVLPFPLGIVFGSEGSGVRYGVHKHLDLEVSIPMDMTAPLSFNVTMAAAIFCYEISRQRIGKL